MPIQWDKTDFPAHYLDLASCLIPKNSMFIEAAMQGGIYYNLKTTRSTYAITKK